MVSVALVLLGIATAVVSVVVAAFIVARTTPATRGSVRAAFDDATSPTTAIARYEHEMRRPPVAFQRERDERYRPDEKGSSGS